MASGGYPAHYEKGFPIRIPAELLPQVYVAGAARSGGELVTSGGRVLGAVAVADTLREAVDDAYRIVDQISFEGAFYRHDIGQRALNAEVKQ